MIKLSYPLLIRNIKPENKKNIVFIINNLYTPWAFIRFSRFDIAEGSPSRRIQGQLFFCAELIHKIVVMIDNGLFQYRVKFREAQDPSQIRGKNNSCIVRYKILDLFTHHSLFKPQISVLNGDRKAVFILRNSETGKMNYQH